MDESSIYSKTGKGMQEASGKTSILSRSDRAVLAQVDGKSKVSELNKKFEKIDPTKFQQLMQQLEKDGFVREITPPSAPSQPPAGSRPGTGAKPPAAKAPPAADSDEELDFTAVAPPKKPTAAKPRIDLAAQARAASADTAREQPSDYKAREEAQAKAAALAVQKTRVEAEVRAKSATAAEAKARSDAEAKAKAEGQAKAAAQAHAKAESDAKAKVVADAELAKKQAEEKARKDAEETARMEAELKAEAERTRAKAEAERIAREEAMRKEAEDKARREAEEQARAEAALKAEAEKERIRLEAERKANEEAERLAREAEERARKEAEEKARREEEERQRLEAERKAKEEAERLRREAEERARKEAEEKARREEEERLRLEAERKAKEEAERKAKEEAERLAREADERARREAEEQARRAEEERQRVDAERLTREAEEKARREGEEKLRLEAERKAKEQAESRSAEEAAAKARAETEANEKKQAEAKSAREAEEKARKDTEAAAAREAEEKSRKDAEAAALVAAAAAPITPAAPAAASAASATDSLLADLDSFSAREDDERAKEVEERARKESEKQARLAAEAKARHEAEEQKRREQEEEQRRKDAEAQVAREAEERAAREEEERKQKIKESRERLLGGVQPAKPTGPAKEADEFDSAEIDLSDADLNLDDVKADAKKLAKDRAQDKDPVRDTRSRDQIDSAARKASRTGEADVSISAEPGRVRKPVRWGKPAAITLLALLVGGLVYLNFMPLSTTQYEKLASDALGQPVKIGSARLSIITGVEVRLEGISIGEGVRIAVVHAHPKLGSLFAEKKVFTDIALEGLTVAQNELGALLFGSVKGDALTVGRISAAKAKFPGALQLPELDIDASLGPNGIVQVVNAKSAETKLTARIQPQTQPQGDSASVEVSAGSIPFPFAPALTLSDLAFKGTANAREMTVTEWSGKLYDGLLSGTARIRWGAQWTVDGDLRVRQMNASVLAPALMSEGRADARGTFAMSGSAPEKLGAEARLEGGFTVTKGVLGSFSLSRALQPASAQVVGRTEFSELTGVGIYSKGAVTLRDMKLAAGMLSATGTADIDASGRLAGRINAELGGQRGTFVLTGTSKEPTLRK